jgi:hypothetical protein
MNYDSDKKCQNKNLFFIWAIFFDVFLVKSLPKDNSARYRSATMDYNKLVQAPPIPIGPRVYSTAGARPPLTASLAGKHHEPN